MQRYTTLLFVMSCALFICASGCTPVQGYAGPPLPENQVSLLSRDFDSTTIEINRATVNGMEFSWQGISLLPGKQSVDLALLTKEPPRNCRPYSNFNNYGYEECLDKRAEDARNNRARRSCNCFDFVEVRQSCDQEVHDINCSGDFSSEAGKKYQAYVAKTYDSASLTVREVNGLTVATGQCREIRTRDQEVDEYVGTGEYTAQRSGIYRCF